MALYQRQYYKTTQVSKKNLNLLSRNCLFIIYVYIYIYIHIIFKVLKTTRKNADEGDHPDSLIKLSNLARYFINGKVLLLRKLLIVKKRLF